MATASDIQYHYDVDNEFYALFLDQRFRAYSCGVWKNAQTLEDAQEHKLDRICDFGQIQPNSKVIDVGCGWGGLMKHASEKFGASSAHGLTLSKDQFAHVAEYGNSQTSVSLQAWQDFLPPRVKFDAVVSVGAFEHFVSRDQHAAGRHREIYRSFFNWCLLVSTERAYVGLQTIVTARRPVTMQEARDARYLLDKVFPGSALPSIGDVQVATADLYEISKLKRIGQDYARTLACWKVRLTEHREIVERRFGSEIYQHYIHYFEAAERSFTNGVTDLLQVSLKRSPITRDFPQ